MFDPAHHLLALLGGRSLQWLAGSLGAQPLIKDCEESDRLRVRRTGRKFTSSFRIGRRCRREGDRRRKGRVSKRTIGHELAVLNVDT